MRDNFYQLRENTTVADAVKEISTLKIFPEIIIIVDDKNVLKGIISTRNLINKGSKTQLKSFMKEPKFVTPDASFPEILRLFSEYNIRLLPVVDDEMRVIGAISVDIIVAQIQEEEDEENESI